MTLREEVAQLRKEVASLRAAIFPTVPPMGTASGRAIPYPYFTAPSPGTTVQRQGLPIERVNADGQRVRFVGNDDKGEVWEVL